MSKKDNSSADTSKQAYISKKFNYDVDGLNDFLDMVFPTEFSADENILTWMTSGAPGYPIDDEELIHKLGRVPVPKALYFGTATCTPDPKDGKLYNRKSLFSRLHVVVLDDIGTKIEIEDLPVDLEPTYIIESSEGNYQYGYVLEEPIEEIVHAEALIQLVYESGYTDAGGKMATKLVRLPDGVNGKPGKRGEFHVKLTKDDGPYWTPAQLLETLDLGVTWDEVLADSEGVLKARAHKAVGLAPWTPKTQSTITLDGIEDPVASWLYERNMVKQETNDWITIKCPWSKEHTAPGDFAGYSPIGRGDKDFTEYRAFHCFHEHCKGFKTQEFLRYVANNGGPEVGVTEYGANLISTYAYDPINDGVWQVKNIPHPTLISLNAFRSLHPGTSYVYRYGKDAPEKIKDANIWLTAYNRVTVHGSTYDPTIPDLITFDSHGNMQLNLFTQPDWGAGEWVDDDVARFEGFMEYLIPDDEYRKYYLDWLAAKVQNMGFRGAAILMIAPTQGTGRTTLSNMISTLFGPENLEHVSFDKLTSEGQFNDWLTKPIIVTDETLSNMRGATHYRAYERLKELVDVMPKAMRINPKYGRQRSQVVYSSYMLFSNHENAMAVAHNDRRIYTLKNTLVPASDEYFTELHAWLNTLDNKGRPAWACSVWRWLLAREINLGKMLSPAPMTTAKLDMARANRTAIQTATEAILEHSPGYLIAHFQVKNILMANVIRPRLNVDDPRDFDRILLAVMRELTTPVGKKSKLAKRSIRLRLIKNKVPASDIDMLCSADFTLEGDELLIIQMGKIAKIDEVKLQNAVLEALDENDR